MRRLLILLVFSALVGEARVKVLTLNPGLTAKLNAVLAAANELHSSLYAGDGQQIETSIQSVLVKVKATADSPDIERNLKRTLTVIYNKFAMAKLKVGDKKMGPLKEAYRQLVQVSRAYKLDKYRLFFCEKDRSVWLQKSWRAKNPFLPNGSKCGILVR